MPQIDCVSLLQLTRIALHGSTACLSQGKRCSTLFVGPCNSFYFPCFSSSPPRVARARATWCLWCWRPWCSACRSCRWTCGPRRATVRPTRSSPQPRLTWRSSPARSGRSKPSIKEGSGPARPLLGTLSYISPHPCYWCAFITTSRRK